MEELVRKICRKESIDSQNVQALSGGQVNAVYLVDGRYVLRLGRRVDASQRLGRETELLRSLEGQVPVPRVLAFGQQDGTTYQIQTYLPGQKLYLIWKDLPYDVQDNLVRELAGYLKVIHGRRFPNFGPERANGRYNDSWESFLADTLQQTLDEIKSLSIRIAPGFIEQAVEYFERNRHVLQDGTPALVHCDLTLVNILVDGGKISALLDFEFALQAPFDYELWPLEAFCLYPNDWAEEEHENFCAADFASFFPLLQKHYAEIFAVPHLRERVNCYQLVAALGSYLAWRKDNLGTIPPDRMAAKEFYMARIANFTFRNGTRLFL